MNILLETIRSINKEETRYFKILSNKTHSESSRKDMLLFDLIRNNTKNYDEKKVSKMMYENKKNNSRNSFFFYRNDQGRIIDQHAEDNGEDYPPES